MSAEVEDAQRRADEWEALLAVYEGDESVSLEASADNVWTIRLGRTQFQLTLPSTYPSSDPPTNVSVYAPHVSAERLQAIEQELEDLWMPDTEVVLLWAEHVRAAIEEVDSQMPSAINNNMTNKQDDMESRPWPTTRLPWSALVEIIQVNQDVPKLRRSQADEALYQSAMANVRANYVSVTDYILATKFGLSTIVRDDGKKCVVHPPDKGQGRQQLVRNDFPYYFETNVEHWILWKYGGGLEISEEEIQQAKDDLIEQLGDVLEFLHWVNPPALKSIPDLDHVHILCLRDNNTLTTSAVNINPQTSQSGSIQFVPPSGKYGQPVRTFDRDIVMNQKYRRRIFRGKPFHPPKSGPSETMIAFCASVECPEHVQWVWAELLLNEPKVAKASHNMVAYRYQQDQTWVSDNDDDGEKGAGAKLASLLELANVNNVMVLVARWYGGVHLGPARFKWIASTARDVLEEAGFIPGK